MRKTKALILLFLLLFQLNVGFLAVSSIEIQQNIIYVDGSNIDGPWDGSIQHPFRFIQDGIDNAQDDDTVLIYPGTYDESLRISSSIHLSGFEQNTTIISSSGSSEYLVVDTVDFTVISNLTFSCINEERLDIIRMIDCHHCIISDVVIESAILQRSGLIVNGSSNQITNIRIKGRFIYAGIELFYTENNTVSHNIFESCGTGILLFRSHNNKLSYNKFVNNTNGLYIEEGNKNHIFLNNLSENNRGLFSSYSTQNRIEQNNFIDNDEQVRFTKLLKKGFLLPNSWTNNYWDDFNGLYLKPILGVLYIPNRFLIGFFFPCLSFDVNPANEPFDIS